VTTKNDAALLFSPNGVAWELVAREGDPISATQGAPAFASFLRSGVEYVRRRRFPSHAQRHRRRHGQDRALRRSARRPRLHCPARRIRTRRYGQYRSGGEVEQVHYLRPALRTGAGVLFVSETQKGDNQPKEQARPLGRGLHRPASPPPARGRAGHERRSHPHHPSPCSTPSPAPSAPPAATTPRAPSPSSPPSPTKRRHCCGGYPLVACQNVGWRQLSRRKSGASALQSHRPSYHPTNTRVNPEGIQNAGVIIGAEKNKVVGAARRAA